MEEHNAFIVDSIGRRHNYLRISLTERCNLRCSYCMPEQGVALSPKPNLMTAEEIYTIAQTFTTLGINKIRLTGGEPLLRKDIKEILLNLATLNVELSITTNGVLVDRFTEVFKQAGISAINLSLDSFSKEKFAEITRRDSFLRVYDNAMLLLSLGFRLKINVVLIKGFNDDEINDFVALTEHMPVEIRFIEFMPFANNKWDKSKLVSLEEVLWHIRLKYPAEAILRVVDKPNDTAKNYKIQGYLGSFALISSITAPFCDSCNRIRLTADGRLKNCLFSMTETPLLPALRAGEPIVPLILGSVAAKHAVRGGMDQAHKIEDEELFSKNRSMITIGG